MKYVFLFFALSLSLVGFGQDPFQPLVDEVDNKYGNYIPLLIVGVIIVAIAIYLLYGWLKKLLNL